MSKHLLQLHDLGHETFWRLLHETGQARPERPSLLAGRLVALLFAQSPAEALEDRLSLERGVCNLGGSTTCLAPEDWKSAAPALPAVAACCDPHADCCVVHGLPRAELETLAAHCAVPVVNGGNDTAQLCKLLGDLALMQSLTPQMDTVRIAWVGGVTGLAHSLIEASIYIPFELFMTLPPWGDPQRDMLGFALKAGAKIFLTRDLHIGLDGAHYVYAGAGPQAAPGSGRPLESGIPLSAASLSLAAPGARLLTGCPWPQACRVDETLLEAEAPLQRQRMAYRLRAQEALLAHLFSAS